MYETLKILHIISFVSWFAGLFYLPRLFVYHIENNTNKEMNEVFQKMEYKLLRIIMNPAMILTWVWLVVNSLCWFCLVVDFEVNISRYFNLVSHVLSKNQKKLRA